VNASQEYQEVRALKLAVGAYILIFALKLAVYFVSGVMALLAEALHTMSDIFISAFLLIAIKWSRKEADEVHMFGYGRAQNVAALVAGVLFISFTSFKLYEEAIPRLFRPGEVTYHNLPVALGVIVASMVIAAAPLVRLSKQKKRGAAAKAQLMELVNDEIGLLAALIGTLFVIGGRPLADPIAAIVVATIIAIKAIGLFRENVCFLLGRSPGPEFLARVESLASVVNLTLLYIWHIFPKSFRQERSIQRPADFGCNCQDNP
jgi:cation diffusion facilitator family transporter